MLARKLKPKAVLLVDPIRVPIVNSWPAIRPPCAYEIDRRWNPYGRAKGKRKPRILTGQPLEEPQSEPVDAAI